MSHGPAFLIGGIMSGSLPRIGVGGVVWRGGEVLLIRRGKPPWEGEWSLPGGAQEPGETVVAALLREIEEETGVNATVLGLVDVIDAIFRDKDGGLAHHYTLIDFSLRYLSGTARAASDAAEVAWVPLPGIARYALWSETQRVIEKSARLHGPLASPSRPD